MKKLKYLTILSLAISLAFISCEKDDICAEDTSTTARLFIEFYNSSNTDSRKNVFNFRVQGVGNDNVLDGYDIVTSNDVYLPLKTDENTTQYELYNDYEVDDDGIVTGNKDILTISYATKEVYVSRACGYKTVFENVTIAVEDDGDTWIDFIQATTDNEPISNETTAHFNLFH